MKKPRRKVDPFEDAIRSEIAWHLENRGITGNADYERGFLKGLRCALRSGRKERTAVRRSSEQHMAGGEESQGTKGAHLMYSPAIGYGWRYESGGVERSCDDRFDVVEHEDGFSVYDNERNDAFKRVYKRKRSAKIAANRVRLGWKPRYAFDAADEKRRRAMPHPVELRRWNEPTGQLPRLLKERL